MPERRPNFAVELSPVPRLTAGLRARTLRFAPLFAWLPFGLAGCGAEVPLHGASESDGIATPAATERGSDDSDLGPQMGEPLDEGGELDAPGIPTLMYPAAPFGTQAGATIADLTFMGWRDPAMAGYDAIAAETIRLSDFYDPDGAKGVEYILLNAVTVWCGVCRLEYEHLAAEDVYGTYSVRGLEVVGVLFEDNDGNPPTFRDLSNWSARYDVRFPFVTDPGFKTGVYFDRDATPMNMIIDAKTMQIVATMTGYDPQIYAQIDRLLTARGR